MILNEDVTLLDIYRSSQKRSKILTRLFNPTNQCFSCLFISGLTLKEVCKQTNRNVGELLKELQ
jgi:hypothetical protein